MTFRANTLYPMSLKSSLQFGKLIIVDGLDFQIISPPALG